MKKFLLVLLNIIVLTSVGTAVYHFYLVELDSTISVECDYNYVIETNSMILNCDVDDADLISSNEYPLTLHIYDNNDLVIFTETLEVGSNEIVAESLDHNALYAISIEGYNFIREEYINTIYFEYDFSTVREDLVIPTWTFTETLLSVNLYRFFIDIVDSDECITSIDITLYDSSNDEILSHTYNSTENLDFSFTTLDPETEYNVDIKIYYTINDYDQSKSITILKEFTTLATPLTPTVELLNVFSNNIDLTFSLITDNKDATSVIYTIELIDLESNVLYSEVATGTDISLDVEGIDSNYYISIKASYIFNDTNYSDIEMTIYSIYINALSNFFVIPDLNIVDTSLPLTSYDDYDDYIYTLLNTGEDEFTIYCEAPINCSELVLNELYSNTPFYITDLVHAYFDINEIGYSYTSTEVQFTLIHDYTNLEKTEIDQRVNTILNSIINESMTEYDKILAVHDYVVNNTVYDSSCLDNILTCDNDHTAIGVFIDHNAVCEGYAHAIDIMLRALEIPTFKVSSDTHQWNAVYYDNTWYHLDSTWDDPVTNNGTNVLDHDYFLITNSELLSLDSSDAHTYITTFTNFID